MMSDILLKNKRILCFHSFDHGRDVQAMAGIYYLLKHQYKCKLIHVYMYKGYLINIIKPDLIILPNAVGSREVVEISRLAKKCGVPLFINTAEGNIPDWYYKEGRFWGWITERRWYASFMAMWNQRSVDALLKYNKNIDFPVKLTGGTGFDIYSIKRKLGKHKRGKHGDYQLTVGYAGWSFGKFYSSNDLNHLKKTYAHTNFNEYVDWAKTKRKQVMEILEAAIKTHPDVLFLLKKHPREHDPSMTTPPLNEMNPLLHYGNVIYLDKSKETLGDIISKCDIWTSFESTTMMEAWLLGIETANLLPEGDNRVSTNIIEGSVILTEANGLSDLIVEYKKNLKLQVGDEILKKRKGIISGNIGYMDGLNHVRFVKAIKEGVSSFKEKRRYYLSLETAYSTLLYYLMIVALRIPMLNSIIKVKKHRFFINHYKEDVLLGNLKNQYHLYNKFHQDKQVQTAVKNILK